MRGFRRCDPARPITTTKGLEHDGDLPGRGDQARASDAS
jgi:hypothetical protein